MTAMRRARSPKRAPGSQEVNNLLIQPRARTPLEHDGFSSNRHPALSFCLSMIFFGKPVPTFPDHALVRDALDLADRVGLTPNGEQRWRLGEIDRGDHALHRGV